MHSLVDMLAAEPEAVYFKRSVDANIFGMLVDYRFAKSYDLGTILAKLNTTAYSNSVDKFVADVRSVFVNAINCDSSENHRIYVAAQKLLAMFEVGLAISSVPDLTHAILRGLVDALTKARVSYFFCQPVDPVAMNIPDYLTVITQPMDLYTLAHTVERGTTLDSLSCDLDLIVSNATTYNQDTTHPVHFAARAFSHLVAQATAVAQSVMPIFIPVETVFPSTHVDELRCLLGAMLGKRTATNYFLRPVDQSALGLEDYFKIARKPIGITTVEARLRIYTSLHAFSSDVQRVFDNAQAYVSNSGLDIYQASTYLSKLFQAELRNKVSFLRSPSKIVSTQGNDCEVKIQKEDCLPPIHTRRLTSKLDMLPPLIPIPTIVNSDLQHTPIPYMRPVASSDLLQRCTLKKEQMQQLRIDTMVFAVLWRSSKTDSVVRVDAAARDAAILRMRILDLADREVRLRERQLAELERDRQALRAQTAQTREAELRSQQERNEARQRARETARRHRDELEQTIDFDQQRLAVVSFLEHTARNKAG